MAFPNPPPNLSGLARKASSAPIKLGNVGGPVKNKLPGPPRMYAPKGLARIRKGRKKGMFHV